MVRFLEPLNAVLLPLVKAGFASPIGYSTGLVVLEVRGRKTGIARSTPLTCLALGSTVIVATVRGKSQWLKNLAAAGEANVWLCGRRRPAEAQVFIAGELVNTNVAAPVTQSHLWQLARALTSTNVINMAVLNLRNS